MEPKQQENNIVRPHLVTCLQKVLEWTEHDDFLPYVQSVWESYPTVGGMRGLYAKVKRLKAHLSHWNEYIFGNVFDVLASTEADMIRLERAYAVNPTPENRTLYHAAQAAYKRAANRD